MTALTCDQGQIHGAVGEAVSAAVELLPEVRRQRLLLHDDRLRGTRPRIETV